jgi:comEA protein
MLKGEKKMTGRTLMILALAATLAGQAIAGTPADSAKVNINTATVQELQLLPRIGPAVAARVVEFRTTNGPFKAVEDLMRVRGIGEKALELLKPYIAVNGATTLTKKVRTPRPARSSGAAAKS